MKQEFKFDKPGTLNKPGWIGRVVRLAMAGFCAYAFYIIYINISNFLLGPPQHALVWVLILLALHLLPFVLNIGFGKLWRTRPQIWYVIFFYIITVIGIDMISRFKPAAGKTSLQVTSC